MRGDHSSCHVPVRVVDLTRSRRRYRGCQKRRCVDSAYLLSCIRLHADLLPFCNLFSAFDICNETRLFGALSILQSATPLLEKTRTFRLIEISQQLRPDMDGLYRVISVCRYYAVSADTKADRTNRSSQEKFLTTFREQIIEKQLRSFRMSCGDRYESDARHQDDVIGRKDDSDRSVFLGPLDRIGADHIIGDQMLAG